MIKFLIWVVLLGIFIWCILDLASDLGAFLQPVKPDKDDVKDDDTI